MTHTTKLRRAIENVGKYKIVYARTLESWLVLPISCFLFRSAISTHPSQQSARAAVRLYRDRDAQRAPS